MLTWGSDRDGHSLRLNPWHALKHRCICELVAPSLSPATSLLCHLFFSTSCAFLREGFTGRARKNPRGHV